MATDRVVTQNLVLSAASAANPHSPNPLGLSDLVALIDTFCLCESVSVIDRCEPGPAIETTTSELLDVLRQSRFVRNVIVSGRRWDSVRATALQHALTLADGNLSTWEALQQELSTGNPRSFLARSLLYVAYADATGVPLVPDTARIPILHDCISKENDVRARLLTAMKSGYHSDTVSPSLRRISPLAAIVFERAASIQSIPDVLSCLRTELTPLRERLREADRLIRDGKGEARLRGEKRWKLVAKELEDSYGNEPAILDLEAFLAFGRIARDLADTPLGPKTWISSLLDLPTTALRRLLLRRPIIHLYRLREDLPGKGRLHKALYRLFGDTAPAGVEQSTLEYGRTVQAKRTDRPQP